MIRLLTQKILCGDLIDMILEAARALLQQLRVAFQCKRQGHLEVGNELEYPWGAFSWASKFPKDLLYVFDLEETSIRIPKFH